MTLNEAIEHFQSVAKYLDIGGKGAGNTHRDIARYLIRLKKLEEMIDNGELLRKEGKNMTCPVCNGKTKILETRSDEESINRRRQCLRCGYRFSTVEMDKDLYKRIAKKNEAAK